MQEETTSDCPEYFFGPEYEERAEKHCKGRELEHWTQAYVIMCALRAAEPKRGGVAFFKWS